MSINPNLPRNQRFNVESVESVENVDLSSPFRDISASYGALHPSTTLKTACVESVEKNELTTYFSTLSTKMKTISVETKASECRLIINNLDQIPRFPQIPQEDINKLVALDYPLRKSLKFPLEWIEIALNEGHIEPSQPILGRMTGWPTQSISSNSLLTDFLAWGRKRGIPDWQMPNNEYFYSQLDMIFSREGNRYTLPPLSICRTKFLQIKEKHASVKSCE